MFCTQCGQQFPDGAQNCPACGAPTGVSAPNTPPPPPAYQAPPAPPAQPVAYQAPAPAYDPYDHTADFDAKDISDNKVICMLVYLMGIVGVFIALLASSSSPYAAFHVRQALKFTVIETLSLFAALILCWTLIVPIAYAIWMGVLFVVKIICFFSICSGKAKEPPILRAFPFLK